MTTEEIAKEIVNKDEFLDRLNEQIVDIEKQVSGGLISKDVAIQLINKVEEKIKRVENQIDAFEYAHLSNVRETKLAWKVVYGVPDNHIDSEGKVSILRGETADPVSWIMNHFYRDPDKVLIGRMGKILQKHNCTKEGIADDALVTKGSDKTMEIDKEFIEEVKNYKSSLPNSHFGVSTLENSLNDERNER